MSVDAVGDAMMMIQQGTAYARKNGKRGSDWEKDANAARDIGGAAHKDEAERMAKNGARDARDAAGEMKANAGDAGQIVQQVLSMIEQGAQIAQMLGGGAGQAGNLLAGSGLASAAAPAMAPTMMPMILPIFF